MTEGAAGEPGDQGDLTTLHVRRALDGDVDSLTWVVSRFTPLLRTQAAYRLGTSLAKAVDPDDIVGDAWLVALQKLPEFDVGDRRSTPALLAYLAQTVRFLANNALRAHLRGQTVGESHTTTSTDPLGRIEDEVSGIVSAACRLEATARVASAIEGLDQESREIVILRGIEGLTNKQIGELLDEKPNTVSHKYVRALETLRTALPESVFHEFVDD